MVMVRQFWTNQRKTVRNGTPSRLYLRYLGCNSCSSSPFAIAMLFSVAKSFTFFASMFKAAVISCVSACIDRVETVAYLSFVGLTGASL